METKTKTQNFQNDDYSDLKCVPFTANTQPPERFSLW